MAHDVLVESPGVRSDGGQLVIDVHWRDTEALHTHLARQGIRAVARFDPEDRLSWLELPPDADEVRVRQAVADWLI
jgi:hypothetical protein